MEKRMITTDEAINLLNPVERIHTFRNGAGILLGADIDRERIIELINTHADTLQIGGDIARGMKHALILEDSHGYLFIENNEEKLNAFDPVTGNAVKAE